MIGSMVLFKKWLRTLKGEGQNYEKTRTDGFMDKIRISSMGFVYHICRKKIDRMVLEVMVF